MNVLVKFLVAILLLAILGVIISNGSATTNLIQTASSTFAKLLGIVVSPIGAQTNTQFRKGFSTPDQRS